jgi:pimeloyl-ACP methyl ester carboxylesterase
MKLGFIARYTFLLCFLLAGVSSARADYASVNGINLYYDVKGAGTPLVFLHGGYDDSDMWNVHTLLLSHKHKIIRIDSRGHGRSELGNLPITYEQMAADTLALLDHLNISKAHFVGWSDGAVIASQIASQKPERVNQLVLFGTVYQADAYSNVFNALFLSPDLFLGSMEALYRPKYASINPDPSLWPQFSSNLYLLWLSPCYFAGQAVEHCLEPLESISAPTLVVAGSQEIIRRSHIDEVANRIPGAELKIVPLASHFLPKYRPLLATSIISQFLNN